MDTNISPSGTDYTSAVRWIIQDTDSAVYEISDAAITALYNDTAVQYGTDTSGIVQVQRVYSTALECAKALHRRYAKQATFSSAGTSVQLNERAQYWLTVVQDIALKLSTLSGSGSLFATVGRNPNYYDGDVLSWSSPFDRW